MPFNLLFKTPQKQAEIDDQINLIEVKIWGFVVVVVTLILAFIVAMLLYSITFVTQPIKSMAPIDQAYTKMLNDIVLLIVGGIGGVMSKRATKAVTSAFNPEPPKSAAAVVAQPQSPAPQGPTSVDWNWIGYKNPELDESWVPPPPPSTPDNYVDPAIEEIAHERAVARSES